MGKFDDMYESPLIFIGSAKIPISLRTWYIVLLVGSMLGIAVAIEIALHFSQMHSGVLFSQVNYF